MQRIKKIILTVAAGLICVFVGFLCLNYQRNLETSVSASGELKGIVIVLDAGHGGMDGGAVGYKSGAKESDINLSIALKLEAEFKKMGAQVIMTRTADEALGSTKDADMQERRRIIESSGQTVTISIHQNSFPDHLANGPQVIHAPGSEEGTMLAQCIQDRLISSLKPQKERAVMEADYFIVNSGSAPAVIVECGFISNEYEEVLLQEKDYQEKIALAVAMGVMDYLEEE